MLSCLKAVELISGTAKCPSDNDLGRPGEVDISISTDVQHDTEFVACGSPSGGGNDQAKLLRKHISTTAA